MKLLNGSSMETNLKFKISKTLQQFSFLELYGFETFEFIDR